MLNHVEISGHNVVFHRFGSGERLMVCLHGYGEDGSSFAYLSPYLPEYTLICPDLPFHGGTVWKKEDFTVEDLYSIIEMLVPLHTQKISLTGFSMGGRMALAFAEQCSECIEKLILIAPDGLHKNFWYWLSTQTAIGNRLFRYTMHEPMWLFNLMKAVQRTGLLNKSVFKFAHYYLDDENARLKLYQRWTAFKTIKPSVRKLASQKAFKTLMVFGRYDRIILPKTAKSLAEKNECIRVKMIAAGHQLLSEKHVRAIAELILNES